MALSWSKITTAHAPTVTFQGMLCYHPPSDKVVQFGATVAEGSGAGQSSTLASTWTYDRTDWTLQSPVHVPLSNGGFAHTAGGGRAQGGFAYLPSESNCILYGGVANYGTGAFPGGGNWLNNVFPNDTYGWTGTDWHKYAPTHTPNQGLGANTQAWAAVSMAYIPSLSAVFFAGTSFNDVFLPQGTNAYSFNGTDWTTYTPANKPPSTNEDAFSVACDPNTSTFIMEGRPNPSGSPTGLGETWTYASSTFSQLIASPDGTGGIGDTSGVGSNNIAWHQNAGLFVLCLPCANPSTYTSTNGTSWTALSAGIFEGMTWGSTVAVAPPVCADGDGNVILVIGGSEQNAGTYVLSSPAVTSGTFRAMLV